MALYPCIYVDCVIGMGHPWSIPLLIHKKPKKLRKPTWETEKTEKTENTEKTKKTFIEY